MVSSVSNADIDLLSIGVRAEKEEPLLSHTNITDWAPQQEMLGFDLDTEKMTISISLPAREMQELLPEWPAENLTATVRGVLVLGG